MLYDYLSGSLCGFIQSFPFCLVSFFCLLAFAFWFWYLKMTIDLYVTLEIRTTDLRARGRLKD